MSDQTLENEFVLRAVDGDAVALKIQLADSHRRLCEYLSPKIPADLSCILDPEDIVQDAHVEVFRHIGTFEPRGDGSFFRWVTVIAVSRLRNRIKHERALKRGGPKYALRPMTQRFEDSTIALLDMLADPAKTPSRSVARHEAVDAMQAALAHLPERNRQAVWLVHIEGRSATEAGLEMGCTERAVQGLCRRGLKLLQRQLQSASKFLSSRD